MLDRVSGGPQRVRTLFLSDIHLGTRGCQADKLLDLLRCYEADTIYLVGDIVDGWQLKSSWYWPQLHNDVVQKLLRQARKGVRLFYIPGNHDPVVRSGAAVLDFPVLNPSLFSSLLECQFKNVCGRRETHRTGSAR